MQVFIYFFLVSKADNEIRVTLSFLFSCLENLLPLYGKNGVRVVWTFMRRSDTASEFNFWF